VGNDVVHDRRRREPSHSLALGTKRMNGEIAFPRGTPPGVITSVRSRSALSIYLAAFLNAMFLAAPMTRIHQHRAARKSARMQGCERAHAVFLFSRSSEIRQHRRQVSFGTLTMDFPFSIT
jgi:hypothetical protein